MDWSKRVPDEEKGRHQEYRGRGGKIGARLDFYLLTGVFIKNLNRTENGTACDGSNINYHRAHNRHTPKLPTIQIMNRPKSEPDVKIRYK